MLIVATRAFTCLYYICALALPAGRTMLVSELSALVGVQQAFSAQQAAMLASLLPSVPHAAVSMCALAHARDEQG